MDIDAFVAQLLDAAAGTDCFQRISLQVEGPIAKGQGYISAELSVRFYFNQQTQTIAFALIQENERIWGVDRDNRRGWHQHPLGDPARHVAIEPQSVAEIIERVVIVLHEMESLNRQLLKVSACSK